jgi:hypothetical protein
LIPFSFEEGFPIYRSSKTIRPSTRDSTIAGDTPLQQHDPPFTDGGTMVGAVSNRGDGRWLGTAEHEHILEIISRMVHVIERSLKATLDEEGIRPHFPSAQTGSPRV